MTNTNKDMDQNRYKWVKSNHRKVLLDSRWNEINTEIGEIDEVVVFDEFQIVRRDDKLGCVVGGNLVVPIEYDIITPSEHHKVLVLQNHQDGLDVFENGIHVLGKEGIFMVPRGRDVLCDDSHETPIIRVDNKWAFYLYSTEMLSQFEYDEIICEQGYVITKKNDNEISNRELTSTLLGYVIASDFADYSVIDEEQILVKNNFGGWTLLRVEVHDDLYGYSKSFESISDKPFYGCIRNKNKTITLEKEGMYYVYFPSDRYLSNPYDRIICYNIDYDNENPFAIGFKDASLAVIASWHETGCNYDFVSTPMSNQILAISSCGGYCGKLKSVCEIINLEKIHEENGYIFITDKLTWEEYLQLYKDEKLTIEKYSKYEDGSLKSINIPFLNDMIVQLDPECQGDRKEIMCTPIWDRVLGFKIFCAWKVSLEMISEECKKRNKEYYEDPEIPISFPSDNYDLFQTEEL